MKGSASSDCFVNCCVCWYIVYVVMHGSLYVYVRVCVYEEMNANGEIGGGNVSFSNDNSKILRSIT